MRSCLAKEECLLVAIGIQNSQIPDFLNGSAFYQSLNAEDGEGEVIQIPERCFKENDEVSNLEDFDKLLHTMQFWGVDVIPRGMIQYLNNTDFNVWQSTAETALNSKSPMLANLTLIYNQSYAVKDRFLLAISCGRCELLEFWLDKGLHPPPSPDDIRSTKETIAAAKHGQLSCLKLLVKHNFPFDNKTASAAAGSGSLECLFFLKDNNCAWDKDILRTAACRGHLHILENAQQLGLEKESVCECAAYYGHLDCLRYAYEHGCAMSRTVAENAALNGQYDCLKYALEHGCEVDVDAYICTAMHGELKCLQLLREHQVPWDSSVSAAAAGSGHLHILQYLHEHHCPWDAELYKNATLGGHLNCIQYAHSQGLPLPIRFVTLCDKANISNHVDIREFLLENGVPES